MESVTPTLEHIKYWRTWAKLQPDEELHMTQSLDERIILLAHVEAGEYPEDVTKRSLIDALARKRAIEEEMAWRRKYDLPMAPISLGYPREFLDELKHRVRLEDEVSLVVDLHRSGHNLKGICPFHPDLNPSFVVFPDGYFHCFGCHLGGDVFTWIQLWMPTDFRGAVAYLSARAGLPLPARRAPRSRELRVREVHRG